MKIPFIALEPTERRGIVEEARMLARSRHANVVTLLDLVEDARGRLVIVLELVRGTDLRHIGRFAHTSQLGLDPFAIASVGRAVCLALAAMQRAIQGGVAHRDVTPHNVLVSMEGEIKLADFGIAKVVGRERWTRTGHLKGKLAYVAPECIRGEESDVKSDLFSLGVLLYELSSGKRPFFAPGLVGMLDAIVDGRHESLGIHAPHFPVELVNLIERLLCPRREQRPTSDEAARAFAAFDGEHRGQDSLAALVRRTRSLVSASDTAASVNSDSFAVTLPA